MTPEGATAMPTGVDVPTFMQNAAQGLDAMNQRVTGMTEAHERVLRRLEEAEGQLRTMMEQPRGSHSWRKDRFDDRRLKVIPYDGDHSTWVDYARAVSRFVGRDSEPLRAAMDRA